MAPAPLRPAPEPTPTLSALTRRLDDVRSYQLPRLRGCTTSLAADLAAEARADLETVRAGLEESREACEALPEQTRSAVIQMWDGVEEEYLIVRDEYRAALVASKRATAAAAKRHELLDVDEAPKAEPTVGAGGDDALQTKTNEVTDAMRRTTQLLQAELEKSVLSVQVLDDSTRTIRSTQGLYDTYGALLNTSSQLVRALERADWWDRLLILSALGFFLLCVGYVIKRRVLDRVGGFASWWIGGSWKLLRMGLGGKKDAVEVARAAKGAAGTAADVAKAAVSVGAGAASVAGAAGAAAAQQLKQVQEKVVEQVVEPQIKIRIGKAGAEKKDGGERASPEEKTAQEVPPPQVEQVPSQEDTALVDKIVLEKIGPSGTPEKIVLENIDIPPRDDTIAQQPPRIKTGKDEL